MDEPVKKWKPCGRTGEVWMQILDPGNEVHEYVDVFLVLGHRPREDQYVLFHLEEQRFDHVIRRAIDTPTEELHVKWERLA